MPSFFSHAIAAAAIGVVAIGGPPRLAIWGLGALCAVLPDMDVIGLYVGIPYRSMLGHRGLSHSLFFAAALAAVVTAGVRWRWPAGPSGARLWIYFFLATASHGLLDAMTNGGLGVAFFAPFTSVRYRFPWRPIVVSPISIGEFIGPRGLRVMWSELAWVWLPAALIVLVAFAIRRRGPAPAVEMRRGRASSKAREESP